MIKSGVTKGTPRKLTFGAGLLFHGAEYNEKVAPTETEIKNGLIGATSDGITFTFTPEFYAPELDGVYVDVKELQRKVGETAEVEASVAEITPEMVAKDVVGVISETNDTNYDVITSSQLGAGHFYSGFGFYSELFDGRPFVILFKNAQCTSGLPLDNKNKESGAVKSTFKCFSDLDYGVENLPYAIFIYKEDKWTTATLDDIDERS